MSRGAFQFLQAILYATLIHTAIADAQSVDRILTFSSTITADRDRTLRIHERFEITNDNGFLDSGFHRRLILRPSGPHRAKPGSIQDIRAMVDGSDAVIRTTHRDEMLDIGISLDSASWARGEHLIELDYTAKHQFLVYDDFEDLNQDISGEWPVSIDSAKVELVFSSGIPSGASITADTGSPSSFQFDCIRTNLPSGVRFETSRAISPNERLFISARFSPRGYFVSNPGEDGIHAVLENHPLLYAWIVFLAGVVVFSICGVLVALLVHNAFGAVSPGIADHRTATVVASVATLLSGASAIVFPQPYTAMPGFALGAYASILISGNPHGGNRFH